VLTADLKSLLMLETKDRIPIFCVKSSKLALC